MACKDIVQVWLCRGNVQVDAFKLVAVVFEICNSDNQVLNMADTVNGPDGNPRCGWCSAAPDFFDYHDREWGFPVDDDRRLFEKICLESFQSGLSWRTILAKRENFRAAFDNFEYEKVARFTQRDVSRLLKDAGIVRHRGKIEAVINNAIMATRMVKQEGSLATFFWRYEPDEKTLPEPQSVTTSQESIALAKELKKYGWKFVGPTTVYAFMQAMGLINDHLGECVTRAEVASARKHFKRPLMTTAPS
jgi:DNA-3-methyladenine glycosylase I